MLTVADTAYAIATVRAEEEERAVEDRLFEDPYARLFAAAGVHAAEGTERFLGLPYFREGVRLRTRFIDDAVRSGLAEGLKQVVILGAGFDMRALRLSEIAHAGATVYEMDSAVQVQRKAKILEGGGVKLPSSVVYVPVDFDAEDFEGELSKALTASGFRMGGGAVFVWEGVIGYIDRPTKDQSLRFMAKAGGPGSTVVFTSAEGAFSPDTTEDALRATGFASCEELGMDVVWRRYWPTPPVEAMGIATVCVARR